MGRKNRRTAPNWAYEDNAYSKFAMIYCDLLKARAFQNLSVAEREFLLVCMVHSRDEKAYGCLIEHLRENNSMTYGKEVLYPDDSLASNWENGYFVFPAKQLKEYGYSSAYGSKLLNNLCKKGFIRKVENNKHRQKVNVYQFSTRWKQKNDKGD